MISGNRYIRMGRWARPWITALCNKERRRNSNRLPAKTEAIFLANCAWWNGWNSAQFHTRDNFHAKGSAAKCSTSVSLNSSESLMWSCSLRFGREPKCLCLRSRHARTLRHISQVCHLLHFITDSAFGDDIVFGSLLCATMSFQSQFL